MKIRLTVFSIVAVATVLFTSCESEKSGATVIENTAVGKEIAQNNNPKRGDYVPSNLVCMVNDAYMGKQQLEVPFEDKMYYGCCEMCQDKIPTDPTVRYAVDPHTLKKVDKATAYIVLIGDNGEVAYFENEANYQNFKQKNKTH